MQPKWRSSIRSSRKSGDPYYKDLARSEYNLDVKKRNLNGLLYFWFTYTKPNIEI
jgi:hypothetical protein